MNRIDYYGILGFGIDIRSNQPLTQLLDFTYQKKQVFHFHEDILIPDQIIYDPSPKHELNEGTYSDVMVNSRQFQQNMMANVGLKGQAKGIEFEADAGISNTKFKMNDELSVRQYVEKNAYYSILQIKNIDFPSALNPNVMQSANECGLDKDMIQGFFDTYGTYVVTQAQVGGLINIQTDLKLTYKTSKKISQENIDLNAEVKREDKEYVKGKLGFNQRSGSDSGIFRENSQVSINLIGGKVTADDFESWKYSLDESQIPTQNMPGANLKRFNGPHFAVHMKDESNQHLGLINLSYTPIYEVLGLGGEQKKAFKEALNDYLDGENPFADDTKRYKPDVPDHKSIKKGDKATFKMRGWMATYETYAGLHGKPGSHATVSCKSDAESGGWTEKKIYAGEVVKLRGKTPYLSSEMTVKFLNVIGDDGAEVYARNRLVSW